MKWLIKILGGYSEEEFNASLIKKEDELAKKEARILNLQNKYKHLDKRLSKYYRNTYNARKYLNSTIPTNQWKKHHLKLKEILDSN